MKNLLIKFRDNKSLLFNIILLNKKSNNFGEIHTISICQLFQLVYIIVIINMYNFDCCIAREKPEVENPSSESGEILGNYVPNSVSLYKLPKHPTKNWKGIEIKIQDLRIDTEKGEYILIGAGMYVKVIFNVYD